MEAKVMGIEKKIRFDFWKEFWKDIGKTFKAALLDYLQFLRDIGRLLFGN